MTSGHNYTKLTSAIIVYCMISASFLGLMALGGTANNAVAGGAEGNDDLFVGQDYAVSYLPYTNGQYSLTSNLTIRAGGVVLIQNSLFQAEQNFDEDTQRIFTITVEDGGQLIIDHSTVTTDQVYQNQAFPALGLIVRNGGQLLVDSSYLQFPGHIVIDNAQLIMRNSTVQAYQGAKTAVNGDNFPTDYFDDAPVMLFMSSDVQIYDSSIQDTFQLTDINVYPDLYDYAYPFAADTASRDVVTYSLQRNVNPTITSGSNAPGEAAVNLTMEDGKFFALNNGEYVTVDGFDVAGMCFTPSEVASITLKMSYKAPAPFTEGSTPNELYYTQPLRTTNITTLTVTKTYEDYDPAGTLYEATKSFTLPRMSSADLASMQVNLTNSKASPVYVNRIWVEIQFALPTYNNITLAGDTNLVAVNSYLDLNYMDLDEDPNKLAIVDQASAFLYGCVQNGQGAPNGLSPYIPEESVIQIVPKAKGSYDNTGATLGNIISNNTQFYVIDNTERMSINSFNVADMDGEIASATLRVAYRTDVGFTTNPTNYITWSSPGISGGNSNILIHLRTGSNTEGTFDLFSQGVDTISEIAQLNISYVNNGGAQVLIDKMWIEVTLKPAAHIFRWTNLTVLDSQGIPVNGAKVDILTASGEAAQFMTPDGASASPAQEILDYLGKESSNFNYTDRYGKVVLPLMTDTVTAGSLPQSYHIDGFVLKATYYNDTMVDFTNSVETTFPAFPQLLTQQADKQVSLPNLLPKEVADLEITTDDIEVTPSEVVTNITSTISATVFNIGTADAFDINVTFYLNTTSGNVFIGSRSIASIPVMQSFSVSMAWAPNHPGAVRFLVVADPEDEINETEKNNNAAYKNVQVLDVPRLFSNSLVFRGVEGGQTVSTAFVEHPIFMYATVKNIGESTAREFTVTYWIDAVGTGTLISEVQMSALGPNETIDIPGTWIVESDPTLGIYQNRTIYVSFDNYTQAGDVPASQVLTIVDDRPDLIVSDVEILRAGVLVSEASLGEGVVLSFNITNMGISDALLTDVYLNVTGENFNYVISNFTADIPYGETVHFNVTWAVKGVVHDDYEILVRANPFHSFTETNLTNNDANVSFAVIPLVDPVIVIVPAATQVEPSATLFVSGTITSSDGLPLQDMAVRVYFEDAGGFQRGEAQTVSTDSSGSYNTLLTVPDDQSGDLYVKVTIDDAGTPISERTLIEVSGGGGGIPWWMIVLIIAIVAAVIIIFALYLYKVGLGKMVECGECGALIPVGSKRCPKCGVAFETGTAKCSECGAWIPGNATECPECHAKFLTEPEEGSEDAYKKEMQVQYEEYVNTYREQAKAALGSKYSEDKFQEWLKTEPGFLPFEAWLAKREEEKKSGAFPCPSCGTLNPRASSVCHQCGTVFDASAKEAAPEKQRTFRRVVKRSKSGKEEEKKP